MIFLLLAIIGGGLVTTMIRLSKVKVKAKFCMLGINYLICSTASLINILPGSIIPHADLIGLTLFLGITNGCLYISSLTVMSLNCEKNGIVLSSVYSKLGLIVPLVISMCFFGEMPSWLQAIGVLLSLIAIVLMNYEKGTRFSMNGLLLLIFLIDGAIAAMSKIFEEVSTSVLSPQFLFYTFFVAMCISFGIAIMKKERPGIWELIFGTCLGVPNFFASRFLLWALEDVPAVIAYPTRGVGIIIVTTLVGIFAFREKLNRQKVIAIGIIMVAMVLLNM